MATQLFKNNAGGVTGGTLAIGGLVLNMAAGQGARFPAPTAGDYFLLTLFEKDVGGAEFNHEIVKVTARVADSLTIERDIEGIVVAAGGTSGGWAFPSAPGLNPSQVVYAELRYTAAAAGNTLTKDANLAGLTNVATARTSLGLGTLATQSGTFSGTSSGTNTGDNAANTLYASDYRAANFVANTDYLAPGGTTTFGQLASTAMSASSSVGGLMFQAQGSSGTAGAAFCTFHRPGAYAVHFGVDTDNKLKFGGWSEGAVAYELYHAKNIATQVLGHHTTGLGFLDKGNSGTTAQTINYASAPHQRITVTGAFVMNAVTNWPSTGNTGELLLELVNGASSAITWTMAGTTQKWWKADGTSVATYALSGVTFQTIGTNWILMWSTDAGTTTNFKVMT